MCLRRWVVRVLYAFVGLLLVVDLLRLCLLLLFVLVVVVVCVCCYCGVCLHSVVGGVVCCMPFSWFVCWCLFDVRFVVFCSCPLVVLLGVIVVLRFVWLWLLFHALVLLVCAFVCFCFFVLFGLLCFVVGGVCLFFVVFVCVN